MKLPQVSCRSLSTTFARYPHMIGDLLDKTSITNSVKARQSCFIQRCHAKMQSGTLNISEETEEMPTHVREISWSKCSKTHFYLSLHFPLQATRTTLQDLQELLRQICTDRQRAFSMNAVRVHKYITVHACVRLCVRERESTVHHKRTYLLSGFPSQWGRRTPTILYCPMTVVSTQTHKKRAHSCKWSSRQERKIAATHLVVWPFACKVNAHTSNNSWLVLQAHRSQMKTVKSIKRID